MDSEAKDKTRCGWSSNDPAMMLYHDREWGVPIHDDRTLFEFLVLEGAPAGSFEDHPHLVLSFAAESIQVISSNCCEIQCKMTIR